MLHRFSWIRGRPCFAVRWASLVLVACLCASPLMARSALEVAAAARGEEVLRSVRVDLDRDGLPEDLAAVLVDGGAAISVWRQVGDKPYQQLFLSRVYDGEVVLKLQARQLVADARPEIIFELREESPDETARRLVVLRWIEGRLRPIFSSAFSIDDLRPAPGGEQTLSFGETSAGYRFVDTDGDGLMELAIRRDVKIVRAHRTDKKPLRVVIGSQETLHVFRPGAGAAGQYQPLREAYHPYLEGVQAAAFGGSSQFLPAHLESKLGRAAVERGMDKVFSAIDEPAKEGEGAAAGDGQADTEFSLQRDPAPRAEWAADGDTSTCWCEGVDGVGLGQWWEASFAKPTKLRMLRLVLGDTSSKKAYRAGNYIRGITLLFSSGDRISFDRRDPSLSSGPLAGFSELPLGDGLPGSQTLIFLSRPIRATWVRVEFEDVRERSRRSRSCLSEVVLYASPASES